ncbi:MAG: hypothetical protein LBC99_02850 [Spirochaetota bacterium]|nr:hypothetical protein [Spirochaetota bacterium]
MKKWAFWAWILASLLFALSICLQLFGKGSLPELFVLIAALAFFLCSGAWYFLERKQAARGWRIPARILAILFFLALIAVSVFWLYAGGDSEATTIKVLEGIYS